MSRLLFNVSTKSNRQLDKEQLERTRNRRKGGPVVTVLPANATLKQRLEYASAKSEQLLGSKKDQVELVTDVQRFDKFINKCIENGIISVDTETDGLDRIDGVLAGVCLYTPGEKGIYVPINHISAMTHELLDGQMPKDIVKGGFVKLNDADVKYILHNAKFDMHTIYWGTGAKIIPYWDTLIGANLLNENEPHGLKYLWHKYCSKEEETAELAKFNTLFDKIPFTMVKPEVAYLYAGFDPIMTYELYEFQSHYLTETDPVCIEHGLTRVAQVFRNIEMPVLPAVWDMEATGVEIDSELSAQLHDKYNGYLDESEEILTKALDGLGSEIAAFSASHPDKAAKLERPINVTSPVQLQILLYDILGLESTDSKKPRGTGEEIIEGIHDKLNNATSKTRLPSVVKAHLEDIKTILGCILDIRGMKKYLSTYIDKLPEACSKRTGRLHCSYNQYGAKCVVGNSIVATSEGFKRIDEICEVCEDDDKFYPIDEVIYNRYKEKERSNYAVKYTDVPTIKITLSCGYTIEGTPHHPILVAKETKESIAHNNSDKVLRNIWKNSEFKLLENIQIGDIVEVPLGYNTNNLDYVELDYDNPVYNTNSKQLTIPKVMNEDFALLLGMYHADGTICDGEGTYSIEIHNCDEDVITTINSLSNRLFNFPSSVWVDNKRKNEASSYITSINLKQFDYLFSKGARNKSIPECIRRSPNSVINAYIKGMTLDSSVYKENKSIRFTMTVAQEDDALFLQTYLASIGIFCSRRLSKDMLKSCGWASWMLSFNSNMYCKFRDIIGFVESSKIKDDVITQSLRTTVINNSYKSYVTKIEYSHNTVYDIHVPDTHSFIVNGIISHNTGRFSSSDPNLQNIPSKSKKLMNGTVIDAGHDIRQLFKAPEGYVFIGGDYSQQEPRCLAFMSQDAQMLDAYRHGKDLYATIASFVYNMPYEECLEFRPDGSVNKEGKQRRSSVKPVLLGILYGRGTHSIAEQMHLSVEEAEKIITTFFEMFPAVADFVYSTQLKASQTGYVETAAGRKRRLPDMLLDEYEFKLIDESKVQSFNPLFDDEDFTDSDEDELEELAQKYTAKLSRARSYKQVQRIKEEAKEDNCQIIDNRGKLADAERKCVNSIIQGSSADITKTSLIELYNDEELKKLGYKTVLTIHDENIGMCPVENVKACSERFREIMLNAARNIIDVPMSVDVEITKRWYGEDYSHKIEELS